MKSDLIISKFLTAVILLFSIDAFAEFELFEDFESGTLDSSKWEAWTGGPVPDPANFYVEVVDTNTVGPSGVAGVSGSYLRCATVDTANNQGMYKNYRECGIYYKYPIDFTGDPVLIEYDGFEYVDEYGVGLTWTPNRRQFITGANDAVTSYAQNLTIPWTYNQGSYTVFNQHGPPDPPPHGIIDRKYGMQRFRLYFTYLGDDRLAVRISAWGNSEHFAGDYLSQEELVISPRYWDGAVQEWQLYPGDAQALYVYFRFRDAQYAGEGSQWNPDTNWGGNDMRIDNIHIRVAPLNIPTPIDEIVPASVIKWLSIDGIYYRVEYRDSALDPWQVASPLLRGSGDGLTWVDSGDQWLGRSAPKLSEIPKREYRVVKIFE